MFSDPNSAIKTPSNSVGANMLFSMAHLNPI